MASDHDQEQHPQPPAQQDGLPHTPGTGVDKRTAGEDAADSTQGSPPANGAAQSSGPSREVEPEPERTALFSDDDADDNASEASIPSDDASEQMISPAVSIPPYWSHSRDQQSHLQAYTSGYTRAVSSASAESVLPPGAITLQDNERDDEDESTGRRSNSSELYGRDRNRACWARSVHVTDYVLVNGSTTNIGAFIVWNIKVETLNVGSLSSTKNAGKRGS